MKKFSGFILIEVIVVFSIILIFLGLTFANYNDFSSQLKLKNDARKLIDILELSKKKATSSELLITPGAPPTYCSNFTGYRLTLNANNYSLYYCCNFICTTNINTYSFSTNISILAGTGNLNFPPLMTGANFIINSVQLKNSAINKCVTISISPIGIIDLNETFVSC